MMNNTLLEEKIKSNIKSAINEELGIADEVLEKSLDILNKIEDRVKQGLEYKDTEYEGVRVSEFSIRANAYKKKNFLISVKLYNFFSEEVFKDLFGKIDCYNGQSTPLWIAINCYAISGTLNRYDAMETIQHEVEHLYQDYKGDKQIFSYLPPYLTASQYINSVDADKRSIAQCVYLSYGFEQNGLINGLYGYLKEKKKIMPTWNDIKDSDAYAVLVKFENSIKYVESNANDQEFQSLCKNKFSMGVKSLLNKSKKVLKRIYTGIGKVLIKIRNERINEGYGAYYAGMKGDLFCDFEHGYLID